MRTLTTSSRRFWRKAGSGALACAMATGLIAANFGSAMAGDCPWIVQPHFDGQISASDATLVNIVFDGLVEKEQYFYGFTVTDIDLAWDLSAHGGLTDLGAHGRTLDVMETAIGSAFEVSDETLEPHTVYLVSARSPVGELDNLGAAIEPAQPFNISFFKTRGATDVSGPLPTRSLPGVEIRSSKLDADVRKWLTLLDQELKTDPDQEVEHRGFEPTLAANDAGSAVAAAEIDPIRHDVQICAYQVAMR